MERCRYLLLAACLAVAPACVGEITSFHVGDDESDAGAAPPTPGIDAGSTPSSDAAPGDETEPDADVPPTPGMTWKAVLMTGDDSITAFDNARREVRGLFEDDGVLDEHMIELSRDSFEQIGGVRATSVDNFEDAMMDLEVGANDGCVVFMTSHGSQEGWYIRGQSPLTPARLDQILDDACGERPTVALVSACYSGVFVDPVASPNRIILTAARYDRTSFGCSSEAVYTYWDGCLIDSLPDADTWAELYDLIVSCIETKEGLGSFTPSEPQGFFGDEVRDLPILYRLDD